MRVLCVMFFCMFCFLSSNSQTKTKIFWDTSLSMENRDIEKDFGFLENYFKKYTETKVSLILFNYEFMKEKHYEVTSGDWTDVKTDLMNMQYDGATSYKALESNDEANTTFVFTDGLENINFANAKLSGNLYIINSSPSYDQQKLKYLALSNSGKLINFGSTFKAKNKGEAKRTYSGKLLSDNAAIRKVSISVNRGSQVILNPNVENSYAIKANPGDSLFIRINDKKEISRVLGNNQSLNIWLEEDKVRLDEVIVEASTEQTIGKTKVKTAYGTQNKDGVGYRVQSVKGEDLSEVVTDISTAVKGKFASVQYGGNEDLSQAVIRGKNSILMNNNALIVVDGTPITSSNSSRFNPSFQSTSYLDPNNIEDITVLNGLAATNRFGSRGSNGVILITTKSGAASQNGGKPKDLALVRDNVYKDDLTEAGAIRIPHISVLKRQKTAKDAYQLYLQQRVQYNNAPEYFIDVFDVLKTLDKTLAFQVLSNILEVEKPSIYQLKAARMKSRVEGNYKFAMEVALRTLELYPFKTQSYLDLAMTHKDLGNNQKALDLLNKISDGSINPDLDFSGIEKVVDAEIKNIIYQYKPQLSLYETDVKYLKNIAYNVRLVFDWNNEETKFELQFVNPQKRFFNWTNSPDENAGRFKDGIEAGYTTEQFEIFEDGIGEWIINVKHLGNISKDKAPNFITCKVYYNYGKPNQRSEYHTIRLNNTGSNQSFLRFSAQ